MSKIKRINRDKLPVILYQYNLYIKGSRLQYNSSSNNVIIEEIEFFILVITIKDTCNS